MADLWIFILNNLLAPRLTGAIESHLQYTIVPNKLQSAIQIILIGFSQNLHLVVDEIIQTFGKMETLVTNDLFENGKHVLKHRITDAVRDPSVLNWYLSIVFYVRSRIQLYLVS